VDGEAGRIVIDADTHPAFVARQVVDAIRDSFPTLGNQKIVDPYRFGAAPRAPLAPRILEIANQLLLLRVDGDRRAMLALKALDLVVQVPKLGIAVRMLGPLTRLAICLQAVPGLVQQVLHEAVAHLVAHGLQLGRQMAHALRRPTQRRVGIARGGGFDQPVEIVREPRVLLDRALAPAAGPARAFWPQRLTSSSRRPRLIVDREIPVAASTIPMPPCPSTTASLAAQMRRDRSVNTGRSS
jgi:hypothetical protein